MHLEYVQWIRDGLISKMTGYFTKILDGEDWTFRSAAAASSLIRNIMGPPAPFGVLPKSVSYRVSNSEQPRKFDGIDINQVFAECLGDVEARRKRESMASKSDVWSMEWSMHYTELPVTIPLAVTSFT